MCLEQFRDPPERSDLKKHIFFVHRITYIFGSQHVLDHPEWLWDRSKAPKLGTETFIFGFIPVRFFLASFKTTTESSKIVGPGTCQTRESGSEGGNRYPYQTGYLHPKRFTYHMILISLYLHKYLELVVQISLSFCIFTIIIW